jgi:anti-sigma factor RsiW
MTIEFNRKACPQYEARLEDFVSGELSGADARDLTQHLKSCAGCSAALEDAAVSTRLLRLAEASPDPGPAFGRTVMARIRSEQEVAREPRGFWQPFISLAWRFAATATLALALMVTYDVRWHQEGSVPGTASVRQGEVHDLFTTDADRVPTNRDDVLIMVAEENHGNN